MRLNKKRVIKLTEAKVRRHFICIKASNGRKRVMCRDEIEMVLGKKAKIGMKLALVDLAEYWVQGVNCD